jgi:hypothetical protein
MPQNFLACDRGQTMLLPPDLTDWVPDDHVVWSILDAVEQMDLSAFYGAYRPNGQGRAAYEPSMMVVALLLYSYARGNRSSRGIERPSARIDTCVGALARPNVIQHHQAHSHPMNSNTLRALSGGARCPLMPV